MTIAIEQIRDAARRLQGIAVRTPVVRSEAMDDRFGAEVFAKAENRQLGGAFKFRGAYNCASRLSRAELDAGLIAISSGNHAQAVARSARLLGSSAVIAMPEDSNPVKLNATLELGAEVVRFDRFAEDRSQVLSRLLTETDRTFIPPYDHPDVIAGQGTAALELIEDVGDLDVLVVPVSGGGLMAGCGIAASALCPHVRLVGVEPKGADDTVRSLVKGERVWIEAPTTIADGLRTQIPGEITFEINRRQIDEMVVVSDDEIRAAMSFASEVLGELLEPSGAVPLAALLSGRLSVEGSRAGLIFSGGNVDTGSIDAVR